MFFVLLAGLIWSFGPLVVRNMDNAELVPWQYSLVRGSAIFIILNLYLFLTEGSKFTNNYSKIGLSGIIGGIIVGFISGSSIGVSGPAAGLAAIVLTSIGSLGGYENFLLAVVLAGLIQICSGFLKAGIVAYYVPSSVIRGMLAGIGIIIVIKQIPHFFGYISPVNTDFTLANIFKFITEGHNLKSAAELAQGNAPKKGQDWMDIVEKFKKNKT